MKELKFRAWIKNYNCYADVLGFEQDRLFVQFQSGERAQHRLYVPIEDCVLEQYTGLKDKNGKEIYEGDIVRFALTDGFNYATNEDGVVTYKLGAFYVVNGLAEYLISDINTNKVEVIGNEFEIEVRMK